MWKTEMLLCGVYTILFAGFIRRTGGSLVFTKEPLSKVFVKRGSDLYLKWKYYDETKPTELSFISWQVFVPGVSWKKMIEENHDGKLIIHSELPAMYSRRVEKTNQATLVIKNVTFEDFSEYRCILNPFQGAVTESAVNVIVTGPAVCKPGIQFVDQGDSATITCNATNVPKEYMTCVTQGPGNTEEIANCSHVAVQDVSVSDGGYYSCISMANINETSMASCYLQVKYPLKMENATCTTVSHFARIGQNVSICCPVRSYPPPIVTWKKNETVLQQGKDTFYTVILDKDNKFGNYTCAATDGKASIGPIVITVMKEVAELEATSTDGTAAKAAKVKWTPYPQAEYYLVNITESDDDILDDIVFVGAQTSLEIHYNTLVAKKAEKKPKEIKVCPVVTAINDARVLAKFKTCLTVRSHQMTLRADIINFLIVLIICLAW